MPLCDMLFSTAHSVEQLVDIRKKKKVDKVLLKVIRTIRAKGNLDGWVKPEANLRTDLKLSDKVIASILKSLSEYYGLDLSKNKSLLTANAITTYIKTNKPNVRDSIFLVDIGDMEVDDNNEVELPNSEQESVPNIQPETAPHPVVPKDPEITPEGDSHEREPVIGGETQATLEPTQEETDKSDDTGEDPLPEDVPVPEAATMTASTEAFQIPTQRKSSGSFLDDF